jgi:hypothetical protein
MIEWAELAQRRGGEPGYFDVMGQCRAAGGDTHRSNVEARSAGE